MLEQRTDDWFALRAGRVTASRIADMMAKTKTGWGASRANYRAQLVVERLTGMPSESFSNAAMQWGTDREPEARQAYCEHMLCTVDELAFAEHPTLEWAGASPDGLVGETGLLEIKCPNTATHIDTLLNGTVPDKYFLQMQWQLACLPGREWNDFVSYDPRLPEPMRLFVKRVDRDDELIATLEKEAEAFLAEVEQTVAQLRAQYEPQIKEAA